MMWLFASLGLAAAVLIVACLVRDELHRRHLTKTAPATLDTSGGLTHRGVLSNEHPEV